MDMPDVSVTWVISVSATVLLLTYFWFSRPNPKLPPFPLRAWPNVGNMLQLNMDPREQFARFRKQCGDIYSIQAGPYLLVVLNGLDVMKEALVKHGDDFCVKTNMFDIIVPESNNRGIFLSNGGVWKEHRAFTASSLRNFGLGQNILNDKIQEEVSHFIEVLEKFKGEPKNIMTFTNRWASNIIISIIVGQRFEYDDSEFLRILEIINYGIHNANKIVFLNHIPWLISLPGDLFGFKIIMKTNQEFHDTFAERYIKENEGVVGEPSSLITAYLQEMKRKNVKGKKTLMDIPNLKRLIIDLFMAGTDTTSSALDWFFLYMVNYPDVQEKIFKEIDNEVGLERAVLISDKAKLIYLTATIMEVFRMGNLIPLGIPRYLLQEVKLRGYTIPKGARIFLNNGSILHDPLLWGDDAERFRPERFIAEDGSLFSPEAWIPFSLGRRVCVGESLVKMEVFLLVSNILQRFQILPADPNSIPPITGIFGITHTPLEYDVRFVCRKSRL